jgi:hypothetical protein
MVGLAVKYTECTIADKVRHVTATRERASNGARRPT